MKKFLISLLLFSLSACVSYGCMLFIAGLTFPGALQPNLNYRMGGYGHTLSRLNEVKQLKNDSLDILFVGSSHAYRGFDTRIFVKHCISSFNLGSSSQTPVQTLTLLKRYLRIIKPSYVIYEVYPPTLVADGVESSLDIIANDANNDYSLSMAFSHNHIKVYNNVVYSYIRSWFDMDEGQTEPAVKGGDFYVNGGYVEAELRHYEIGIFSPQRIEINENQFESFESVLDLIAKEESKVILVYAPITDARYLSFENVNEFDQLMKSFGPYYNFNSLVELDDSLHFYDSHHLNQLGVEIFNRELIRILESKHLIKSCEEY